MTNLITLRERVCNIVKKGGAPDAAGRKEMQCIVDEWFKAEGPRDDVVVHIAENVFNSVIPPEDHHVELEAAAAETTVVSFDFLHDFMTDTFVGVGVPKEEAKVCADVLVEADKRGISSHGVGRLKPIYYDRIKQGILSPTTKFEVVKETETTALVDGHIGMGLYIGVRCMEMAIAKAKKHGIGMVAARNSTHYGIAGYYTIMASKAGCIGITGTNARPSIAPTYGVEPLLGTNPLTFGFPTDEEFPFVLDCATSINQRGKIERYAREGMSTPYGCVIGADGSVRTDTDAILRDLVSGEAALAPLGGVGDELAGYKGYGYATVVEVLSAALQDGDWGPSLRGVDRETGAKKPMALGHFFIAIDTEHFAGLDRFKAKAGEIMRGLRNSKKVPGHDRIYTAGEIEHEAELEGSRTGGVHIGRALQQNLIDIRNELNLTKYEKLPFEE
eukprot:Rmarinus@m.19043